MRSKRKIFLICSALLLVSALTPVLLIQSSADASENLKESSIEELSKDSTQTVEISTATTYTNDFEITEVGSLAKDKAAEMRRIPSPFGAARHRLRLRIPRSSCRTFA